MSDPSIQQIRRPLVAQVALSTVLALSFTQARAAVSMPSATGVLTGTIVDWPIGSTGTLRLVNEQYPDLADAPIDATGHFSIQLPSPDRFAEKLPTTAKLFIQKSNYAAPEYGCRGQGSVTPFTGHFQFFGLFASVGDQPPQRLQLNTDPRWPRPVGTVFSDLLYLDIPTTLNGTIACNDGTDTYRGLFPDNWSFPKFTVTAATLLASDRTVTPDPLPLTLQWRLRDQYVGVGITFDPAPSGASGFTVSAVTTGGPAALAGLQAGDVLVEIDGKDITALSLSDMKTLIRGGESGAAPGTKVTLGIRRGASPTILRFILTRDLIK